MNAKQFLDEVFGNKPTNTHICIWTYPSRRSHFFDSTEKAAEQAEILKTNSDVYVACGLFGKNLGPVNRGKKEDVVGLAGFWMDIDVAGPAHKKNDLPVTTDEAIKIIKGHGFDPTLIVKSGHGIHAWWLFKEPLIFDNKITGDAAELANQRLQETIKSKASEKGWKLDSTHDITRVLRVPGTFNKKGGVDTPVECIESNGPRYSGPEDLEPYMVDETHKKTSAKVSSVEKKIVAAGITLNQYANIPANIDMMMSEPKFRATWHANRPDFTKDSPSEYVMSIASFGVRWGLTDQDIADLIVVWYRQNLETPKFKFKDPPISMEKVMRSDYIPGTIARAKHQIDKTDAKNYVKEAADIDDPEILKSLEMTSDLARQKVSQAIGLNIVKIIKYVRGEKDPYYDMETATQVVQFKTPEDLFKLEKFKMRLAGSINIPVDITPKEWKSISRLFHTFMVEEHVDANQSTVSGRVGTWVESYLEDKQARPLNDVTFGNEPFVHKGAWHVFPKQFQNFVWQSRNATGDISDIELDLRRSGAEKTVYNYPHPTRKGNRRKITVWKLPLAVAFPPPMVVDHEESDPICEPLPAKKEAAL